MGDQETADISLDEAIDQGYEKAKAEPVKEESSSDTESTQQEEESTAEETETADQTEETVEESLLSEEEEAEVKDDPVKLKKALQRSYTQKTQKLAEQRKQTEAEAEELKEWKQIRESWNENPQETLRWLQQQAGTPETDAPKEETPKTSLREVLMEQDPEQLAVKLDQYIEGKVTERTSEIQTAQAKTEEALLLQQAEKDLQGARERHKDWDDHFPEIAKMMKRFQPAPGSKMDAAEYYDTLYNLVTLPNVKEQVKKEATSELTERIRKSSISSEKPTSGVKGQIVTPALQGKNLDEIFDSAFELAKRGQRIE
jgi:hypothetical protein